MPTLKQLTDLNDAGTNLMNLPELNSNCPEKLYHYTANAAAVKGMVEGKKLFLSPHDDLNDPSETQHGLDFALTFLKQTPPQSITQTTIDALISGLINPGNLFKQIKFFFACFSEVPEDVSQWRAYADNGNGYCIVFNTFNMVAKINSNQNLITPVYPLLDIRKVIYEDEIKIKVIADFFEIFRQILTSSENAVVDMTLRYLMQLSSFFKNRAYKAEKEWRFVQLTFNGKGVNYQPEQVFIGNHFREKILVDIPCHKKEIDSIFKVQCGPKQNESNLRALKIYLQKHAQNVLCESSKVPMK